MYMKTTTTTAAEERSVTEQGKKLLVRNTPNAFPALIQAPTADG